MTFPGAISEAVRVAKEARQLCYVIERHDGDGYTTTFEYQKGWLFKAYPGGRKELSVRGNELVEETV
jgi:hypothetical protein